MKYERTPTTANKLGSSDEVGYLAYVAGLDGRFHDTKEFGALDDEAARKFARQLGEYVELWTSTGRFIVKLRPMTNTK